MASKFVSVSLLAIHAAASVEPGTCSGGECPNEENSMLSIRSTKKGINITKWFDKFGVNTCYNSDELPFACGDGECCGNACKAEGDLCCTNTQGYKFPCGGGGKCCGNGCAGEGSKCCNEGQEDAYPVADGTACTDESVDCVGTQGQHFVCGKGSTCCGDLCAAPGDTCCQGVSHNFVCCAGNGCCGNSCLAPGSKCCDGKGLPYPVTIDTKCAGSGQVVCHNPAGHEFLCAQNNSCCGGTCVAPGGVCCQNTHGDYFPCGQGSHCGTNVCLAN